MNNGSAGHFFEDIRLHPGGEIIVDVKGRTDVPGIYAAGDATTIPYKRIVVAMGDGGQSRPDRLRGSDAMKGGVG